MLSTGGGPLTDNVVFTAISGFSAFKGTVVLILATWNSQLAKALSKDGSMIRNEGRLFAAISGFFLLSVQRFFGSRC